MRIAEIFHSIQGEGKLAGMPSTFIRTSGCNLRCTWCDTPYSSWQPDGQDWSVDQIVRHVATHPATHVVITGGEPMIAPDVGLLTAALKLAGYHITIETAATVFTDVQCDLASISPKLANSTPWRRAPGPIAEAHEDHRINIPVIRTFMDRFEYQLKFVVEHPGDLDEIDRCLARLGNVAPADVLLMPEGTTPDALDQKSRWLSEICKQRGFRLCPRWQILLYGCVRGT